MPTVTAFDLSMRIPSDDPEIHIEGRPTIPARARAIQSVEMEIERRVQDFEVAAASPLNSAGPTTPSRNGNAAIISRAAAAPAGLPLVFNLKYRIGRDSAKHYLFSLLCVFALGIPSRESPAQTVVSDSDCATLRPEQSPLGYRRVGNRCEGFYLPSLSARLQVVSFNTGSIGFSWAEDTQLTVAPVKATREPLHVRAVSLQRDVFYRMDAVLEPAATLIWPIRRFVFPREIRPDQLGVYGWTGDESDKTFVPVSVRDENSNDRLPKSLTLRIRTVRDLTHFRWALVEFAHDVCHAQPGVNLFRYYEGVMNAGAIIDLEIPGVIPNTGDACLEVQYRPNNQRWMAEQIKIRI